MEPIELDETLDITEVREKVEYFRTKGTVIKDQILKNADGEKILIPGNGKRGKGKLKGVMVAYVPDGEDIVRIGFSMCHRFDRWDHIRGVLNPGHGKYIATERADKWVGKTEAAMDKNMKAAIGMLEGEDPGPEISEMVKSCVVIPDTMYDSLKIFVGRCKKYYKDKRFPVWVDKL